MTNIDAKLDFSLLSHAAAILDDPKRLKAALAAGKTKEKEVTRALKLIPGLRRESNG